MRQAHIFVNGFVQGVGYRQFVKSNAKKLGLCGWVKNLPDRRVEAIFQGSQDAIEKIILLCKKGSFLSEVEDVEMLWEEEKEEYMDFSIIK